MAKQNSVVLDLKNEIKTAAEVLSAYPTLRAWQGQVYQWDGIKYVPRSELEVRKMILDHLLPIAQGLGITQALTHRLIGNVFGVMRTMVSIPDSCVPPFNLSGKPLDVASTIVCSNGVLNVVTKKFTPHTPDLFTLNSTAVEYHPAAKCLRWLKFLDEVFEDDAESILLLREFIGYLLTQNTHLQKGLMISGKPRSGKGTITTIIQKLLGTDNCTSPSLSTLAGSFGTQSLIGKSLMLVPDARKPKPDVRAQAAEVMLNIIGEDSIDISRKHIGNWSGKLNTRVVIASNVVMALADEGAAFASRWMMLEMGPSFLGREDTTLRVKLAAELPGILNWALDGLKSLNKRGHFVSPKRSASIVDEMRRGSNTLEGFFDDVLVMDANSWISKDALFYMYQQWCSGQGMENQYRKDRFMQIFKALPHNFSMKYRPMVNGERLWAVQGIKVNPAHKQQLGTFPGAASGVVK